MGSTTITQEMRKYVINNYKQGRGAAENSATNIAAKLGISDKSVLNVYRDHVNTLLELDKSREETLAKARESKQRLTTRIAEAKQPPLQMDWLPQN